jgi:hypothetical protein
LPSFLCSELKIHKWRVARITHDVLLLGGHHAPHRIPTTDTALQSITFETSQRADAGFDRIFEGRAPQDVVAADRRISVATHAPPFAAYPEPAAAKQKAQNKANCQYHFMRRPGCKPQNLYPIYRRDRDYGWFTGAFPASRNQQTTKRSQTQGPL